MKPFSFNTVIEKLSLVAKRFPVSILLTIGVSVLLFMLINGDYEDIPFRLWLFYSIGIPVGIATVLGAEDFFNNLKTCAISLITVLLWSVYCFFLPDKVEDSIGQIIEIIVISASAFFAIFFISFLKKDTDKSFWNFTAQTFFQMVLSQIFGSLLFGGLSLAMLAINGLFDVSLGEKMYANLAVVCLALFPMIYFLANIPDKIKKHNNEIFYHKTLKILALYILTPILAVYAIILYAYLFKIILTWELPNGWISWLVSILALGGLLVITLLYPVRVQGGNKAVAFLSRWLGLLILPLLVLMTIGIFRRIGDYGITINRCYILLLNLWFYGIYLYLFLTKSKHIKWILMSFVGIALITSIGPWSVANIVKYSPTEDENRRLYNGITEVVEVEKETYFAFDNVHDNEVCTVAEGFDTFVSIDYYNSYSDNQEMQFSFENGVFEIKIVQTKRVFHLPLKRIVKNDEKETKLIQGEDYIFIVRNCYGYYYETQDSIDLHNVRGYLFYKER